MTVSLLERSARYIDEGTYEGPRSVNLARGIYLDAALASDAVSQAHDVRD